MPSQKLRFVERAGYAAGDTASCLYYQTFSLFLMIFYTDVVGLAPAAVGTMLLVTRFWDNLADPVMGMIADRTHSRFGKFRPWLLWMAAPFGITGILAFLTPSLGLQGKLVYAYVTYTLVMLAYTAINIPYGALLGVLTPDSEERTRLSSYRFIGAFTGNLIVQGRLFWLIRTLGHGNDRLGYPLAMSVFAAAAVGLFLFTFSATRERVVPLKEDRDSTIWRDLKELSQNTPWLVLGLTSICCLVWISVRNAAMMYYFKYYVGAEGKASAFMVAGTVATLAGVACTSRITGLLRGKKSAYIFLSLANTVTLIVMYWVRPTDLPLMYAMQIAGSFLTGPLFPLIWAMYADSADYGEWKSGRRTTGLIFSAGTFSQKMGWAVGAAIAGWILALYGFRANVAQTVESLNGIRAMMSTLPAIGCTVTALAASLYGLNSTTLKQIAEDLAARKSAAAAALETTHS